MKALTRLPPNGAGRTDDGLFFPSSNPPILPSSASGPVPSEKSVVKNLPPSSVKQPDLENVFLDLRANGWSLRSISKKLGVPKSTLFNWESNPSTRRVIDTLKCVNIEKLQERYLPSFEEELQKLSSYLCRIERALEKKDFDSMRPEFLLRTFLQLRSRLHHLRTDAQPIDTLNSGPNPKTVRGCISRSHKISDTDPDEVSPALPAEASAKAGSTRAVPASADSAPLSPLPHVNLSSDSMTSSDTKWDKNQNFEMSQPSSSATSADKVGTPVPIALLLLVVLVLEPSGARPPVPTTGGVCCSGLSRFRHTRARLNRPDRRLPFTARLAPHLVH